jgi:hypothetical protein
MKRRHLEKYGSKFMSVSGQSFQKVQYNPFSTIDSEYMANLNRVERYRDFDQMEFEPIIFSALDVYADEITTHSTISPLMKIDCPNEEIKAALEVLYYNILNVEHNLFGWTRSTCKYGDMFVYLDIDENEGVQSTLSLPIQEIERLEGEDPSNPNYIQYQWNTAGMTFENWQIAHFRILGNDKYSPYGTSVLDGSRRIFRQLNLIENAMLAYRIVRSPERKVFYIDVGNIAPQDVETHIQQVITQMKRHKVVDEDTGEVALRYNPTAIEEDYYLPVRGAQTSTRIETLPSTQYVGVVDDIQYLKNKLYTALKIPQSYLDRGEGNSEDKTTLASKDIFFARTIQRLQRCIVSELEKIGIIHLYILGFRGEDLIKFRLQLQNPSRIAELQELEDWQTRLNVAASASEGNFSTRWVAKNILGVSDDEIVRMRREQMSDAKFNAELEKIGAAAEAEMGAMDDLSGAPDDMGDLEDLGDEDMAEEEPAEPPADEDDVLLAAPAKRDETTTPRSKGKMYSPVKYHGGDRRKAGARKRNMQGKYNKEMARNTSRNIHKGYSDLKALSAGIYETVLSGVTNYEEDEEKMIDETESIIEELENEYGKKDSSQ